MDIRILPSNIANMIAAGEVVQRPSSVVKELMENAVDAGADKITVCVQDAGRTLIQVIDNGCGMNPDQAVLCFERHATSKIACAEDLQAIETFGFRGEALASIAAVAEVTLKTRTADMDVATQVTITDATANDPGRQDVTQVAAPVGSNFAVRNLFYNTPARRKFLKSDASELKQIIAEFVKLALSRIDIAFVLNSNGKDIYNLPASQSLKIRIRDIFGNNSADELIPLEAQSMVTSIEGFISRPDAVRKTMPNQYFFVNGRFFRCPYLHKAVMKAYENLIPDGGTPSYYLYLTLDPHTIDVNVHPTKTEIKFEDDSVLFTVMMAAVREALGRGAVSDSLDFERGNLPEIPTISSSFEDFRPIAEPAIAEDPGFNPFDNDGYPNERSWEPRQSAPTFHRQAVQEFDWAADAAASREKGSSTFPPMASATFGMEQDALRRSAQLAVPCTEDTQRQVVVKGRYIVLPGRNGIMVVDSLRAMQRLLYDEFLEALAKNDVVGQAKLFPLEVEIGAENIALLDEYADLLSRLGFSFSAFSANTILVNAIPEGLVDDRMAVSALVYEVITALSGERESLAGSIYSSLAQRLALSASRTAQLPSTSSTALALTDRLFKCENPEFTPDGHRIVCSLKSDDLEKMFR